MHLAMDLLTLAWTGRKLLLSYLTLQADLDDTFGPSAVARSRFAKAGILVLIVLIVEVAHIACFHSRTRG